VVVADLALALGESFGWLRRLLERCPESRVIVLSTHDEPIIQEAAFAAGAAGFVLKRNLVPELLDAVDAVLAGRRHGSLASTVPHGPTQEP
jgi:DNA-binding NarL/FixJ family response regulator